MLGQNHTAGSKPCCRGAGQEDLQGPRRSRAAAAFLREEETEGTRPCSAASARPPGVVHSHISCFMGCLDQRRRNKNTDAEAALDTSLSAQLFPSLPGCLERQGNERFFHYLENVIFSTSEGCQSPSPREWVTMFSHTAGVTPAAKVTVAPAALACRGGTAGKAGFSSSGPCREAR